LQSSLSFCYSSSFLSFIVTLPTQLETVEQIIGEKYKENMLFPGIPRVFLNVNEGRREDDDECSVIRATLFENNCSLWFFLLVLLLLFLLLSLFCFDNSKLSLSHYKPSLFCSYFFCFFLLFFITLSYHNVLLFFFFIILIIRSRHLCRCRNKGLS